MGILGCSQIDYRISNNQKPGMQFDKSSLDFTREYIIATEEELARTESVGDFYYAMDRKFPDANLGGLSNEMNANVFKGGRDSNCRCCWCGNIRGSKKIGDLITGEQFEKENSSYCMRSSGS